MGKAVKAGYLNKPLDLFLYCIIIDFETDVSKLFMDRLLR
jgi:hypothetical protein